MAQHILYCHLNPVKHRLVARPKDWPWSSVHRARLLGQDGNVAFA
ncbi:MULTISPECIES: hypothetical protein [unclassified Sulfitobacter]|nr:MULTISPECIES: hypothetical protein [unclassified Sulfitobacter]